MAPWPTAAAAAVAAAASSAHGQNFYEISNVFAANGLPPAVPTYATTSQPPTATPGITGSTKPQSGGGGSGSGGGGGRYNNNHRNNSGNSGGSTGGGHRKQSSRNSQIQLQQAPQTQLTGSNIIVPSVGVGGTGGLVSVMPAAIVDPHQQQPMAQQHQMQQQPPPNQQSTTSQQQSGSQQSSSSRHYSSMKSNTGMYNYC